MVCAGAWHVGRGSVYLVFHPPRLLFLCLLQLCYRNCGLRQTARAPHHTLGVRREESLLSSGLFVVVAEIHSCVGPPLRRHGFQQAYGWMACYSPRRMCGRMSPTSWRRMIQGYGCETIQTCRFSDLRRALALALVAEPVSVHEDELFIGIIMIK